MALVNAVSPLEIELPTFPVTLFFLSNSEALWYAEVAPAVSLPVMLYLEFTSFALFAAAEVASYSFPVMLCSSLNFFAALACRRRRLPGLPRDVPDGVLAGRGVRRAARGHHGGHRAEHHRARHRADRRRTRHRAVSPRGLHRSVGLAGDLSALLRHLRALRHGLHLRRICSLPCRTPARLRYSEDFPRISAASAGVTEAARSSASAARV